jgi:hypothetical protein
MNKRTLEIELARKHQDFLNSIEDKEIKKLVNDNSIITGGCITSMLLGEKVSDYDYYFTDKETVLKVANYFVSLFNQNHKELPNSKVGIPKVYTDGDRVRIMIKSAGIISESTKDAKYEYFEGRPDEEGDYYVNETMKVLSEADKVDSDLMETLSKKPYRPIFLTDNAITLSNRIQLVIRFYGTPEEIHRNFDYVHCTNYWVSKTRKLTLNQDAVESILAKELRYIGSKYPICSVIRLRKFLSRGWKVNAGQILKILLQVSELKLTNIKVLDDQLTGVDTAYFHDMIIKLKHQQDKSGTLTMPYIISIIDRMW